MKIVQNPLLARGSKASTISWVAGSRVQGHGLSGHSQVNLRRVIGMPVRRRGKINQARKIGKRASSLMPLSCGNQVRASGRGPLLWRARERFSQPGVSRPFPIVSSVAAVATPVFRCSNGSRHFSGDFNQLPLARWTTSCRPLRCRSVRKNS